MRFVWLATYFAALVWSAVNPHDYFTWFLEAAPASIALAVLAATHKRFPLTPVAYTLILIHCLILFVGAHYTYAAVDIFKWVRDFFAWQRTTTISSAISRKALCRRSSRGKFSFAIMWSTVALGLIYL
jgi:uncharacterized membrane protein YjdF